MKRLFFFLLVTNFAIAQSGSGVEIHLVNPQIGYAIQNDPNDMYASHETNDIGLNQILQNYGWVSLYYRGEGIVGIYCESLNLNQLVLDLLVYSNVVSYAHIMTNDNFTDRLETHLINPDIGYSTDFVNNSGITNDPGLNQIFQNFNVYYYAKEYSSISWASQYYLIFCNCDNVLLKAALDDYNVLDQTTLFAPAYLSATKFGSLQFSVTPNPFTYTFNIEAKEKIQCYSICDLSGKQIVDTTSKTELDTKVQSLTNGIYILKLLSETGKTSKQKLIKQ